MKTKSRLYEARTGANDTVTRSRDGLPNRPSALIRVALDDLVRAEKSDKYVIHMGIWHSPFDAGRRCHVCLAGSVIAGTLKVPIDSALNFEDIRTEFGSSVQAKLDAIDFFRSGDAKRAFSRLGLRVKIGKKFDRSIPGSYVFNQNTSPGFKSALRRLARDLEKAGL